MLEFENVTGTILKRDQER